MKGSRNIGQDVASDDSGTYKETPPAHHHHKVLDVADWTVAMPSVLLN